MRMIHAAALTLAATAAVTTATPAAALTSGGMSCAEVLSSNLTPGGSKPNYLRVENCGSVTRSWRYSLNSTGWRYVSVPAHQARTTTFPRTWAKLSIEFSW